MAISETSQSPSYVLDGVGPYTIPFKFLEDSHVAPYIDGVLYEGSFTLNGEGADAGGSLTFATAPEGGQLDILREIPLDQVFQYREGDSLPAEVLENNYDRTVMQIQYLNSILSRTVRIPVGKTLPDGSIVKAPSTTTGQDENGGLLSRTAIEELAFLGISQVNLNSILKIENYRIALENSISSLDGRIDAQQNTINAINARGVTVRSSEAGTVEKLKWTYVIPANAVDVTLILPSGWDKDDIESFHVTKSSGEGFLDFIPFLDTTGAEAVLNITTPPAENNFTLNVILERTI